MKLTIPTDMSEVTLKQYQDFMLLQESDVDDTTKILGTIEIFCNITNARAIEFESIEKINEHLIAMLQQKPSLKPFWLNFGFVPNLRTLSFGELIDLDNYLGKVETHHKAMAVLFRPVEAKFRDMYTIEPYESATKYEGQMLEMPLDIAMGSLLFFWTIGLDLAIDILPFLKHPLMESLTTFRPTSSSPHGGDGMSQSLNLQAATS